MPFSFIFTMSNSFKKEPFSENVIINNFSFVIVFKFKSYFTFSFKNVLWFPESNSIRNDDFIVLIKLLTQVLAVCNKTGLLLQLPTFTAVESVWRATELFKFPSVPVVWFELGKIVLKLEELGSEFLFRLVLSFFKQAEILCFPWHLGYLYILPPNGRFQSKQNVSYFISKCFFFYF